MTDPGSLIACEACGKDIFMSNLSSNELNGTAEVGGGESAFEMFMSGASIDEVNAKFFSSVPDASEDAGNENREDTSAADNRDNADALDASENRDADADNEEGNLSARQSEDAADDVNTDERANADDVNADNTVERKFTQAEVDATARRVRLKEKGAHDRLQSEYDEFSKDVARFLGVDTSDKSIIRNTLKTELLKREADAEGVEDIDLYARAVNAENELENLKRQREDEEKKAYVDRFLSDVGDQLDGFASLHPEVDIESFSKRADFNTVLKTLYATEETKDKCVQKAFEAFGAVKKSAVPDVDAKAENAKRAVDANKQRAAENASSSKAVSKTQVLDYSKLSPKDFLELGKRASKGEIIIP